MKSTAILAGGCFWGMEDLLRALPGVLSTEVGYTGGATPNPTYPEVKTGKTGHAEAIQIHFDPKHVRFEDILDLFFKIHDPTTLGRQGGDIGSQYRSAIFFLDETQRQIALKQKAQAQALWKKPVVTEIVPAVMFYSAEEYHQDYLKKNPGGYTCHYLRQF